MRSFLLLFAASVSAGCSTSPMPAPSLAPRAAEAIDPRLPVSDSAATGTVDPALAARLQSLVSAAREGDPAFEAREAVAARLADAAGAEASESWIAAQQALSRLVEQHGVTTRTAADIDALAANRLEDQRWIAPADREAIVAAAAEVGAINERQVAAIDRVKNQLAR